MYYVLQRSKKIFAFLQQEYLTSFRVHTKKLQPFFKDFSRTTLDFQGPPTRNIISQIVQKRTFSVYSYKAVYTFQFTSLKLMVNSSYCIIH